MMVEVGRIMVVMMEEVGIVIVVIVG